MSTLRLLIVYTGSCGIVLFLVNRYLLPVSRFARVALVLLPALLTGRALLTGSFYGPLNLAYGTPPLLAEADGLRGREFHDGILSDVGIQMVPWRKAVRESFKHGQLPLWNRFMLSGDVLLGAGQPAPFHPTTLLSCLLPLATAWTFSSAFTFFLAAAFGFLFLRELGLSEVTAILGGATWMLSAFMVFFVGWPQSGVFAALPMLLFGMQRLRTGSPGGFGSTLCAFILAALGGHPESLLHVTAAAGLYLLLELARTRSAPWKPLLRGAAAGVLAFGIAAPVLLPFLQVEKESVDHAYRTAVWAHQKKSHTLHDSMILASAVAFPNSSGPVWTSFGGRPDFLDVSNAFVGGGALALAILGIWSRRKEKWSVALVGAAALAVSIGFPGVADGISRLPLFDLALNVRFAGVAALCLAVLAAFGFEELLQRPDSRNRILLFAIGGLFILSGVALRRFGVYRTTRSEWISSVLLLAGPALVLACFAPLVARRGSPVAAALIFLIVTGAHLAELVPLYPTIPSRFFYPPIPELSSLPKSPEPYRVTATGLNLVPNQSALWELEDPRGYEGMTNLRYDATYPLWCVKQPIWFNRVDDLTKPFLAFLNVRFALGGPKDPVPAGWRELTRGNHCAIFENLGVLPRAFIPKQIVFVANLKDAISRMNAIPDFASTTVVEDPHHAPATVPNGRGEISTLRRNSKLEIAISARESCWVVVSNTRWSGWKASDNGTPVRLYDANGAFLAFRIGPGEHRIHLEYFPAGFSAGVGIAAASCAVLLGCAILNRRRRVGAASRGSCGPSRGRDPSASPGISGPSAGAARS
jgi:Bacterial membrane protein YfhO